MNQQSWIISRSIPETLPGPFVPSELMVCPGNPVSQARTGSSHLAQFLSSFPACKEASPAAPPAELCRVLPSKGMNLRSQHPRGTTTLTRVTPNRAGCAEPTQLPTSNAALTPHHPGHQRHPSVSWDHRPCPSEALALYRERLHTEPRSRVGLQIRKLVPCRDPAPGPVSCRGSDKPRTGTDLAGPPSLLQPPRSVRASGGPRAPSSRFAA